MATIVYDTDNSIDTADPSANGDINSPKFPEGSDKSKIRAIKNACQALAIAEKLNDNDRERDIRRARVLAAFNGEAPYSDSELVSKAQGYRYNVSFGFMEGVVGRAIVPYNELTLNIGDLTEIQANLPDEKLKVIQGEFTKIMEKWGKWPKFISRLNQDLVLNGYNAAIFPSDYDPFPVFVSQKLGFVDDGSPNDVNDLEVFVWKKSYLLHELYTKISDQDVAKKAGWNVQNVKKALMSATPQSIWNNNNSSSGDWTAFESAIRGGSLFTSLVGAKMVNAYHVMATELDGKVTYYIVLDQNYGGDSDKLPDGPELFKKEDRFDNLRDVLVYFDLETGDGTWHGSKGIGQKIFNTHKAIDKLRCSTLDTAFTSGLTLLQATDQLGQEELTLAVVGPFAVIPPGLTVNPGTLPANAATTFQVDNLLAQTSEQRVGDIVPQGIQSITGVSETATAARIKAGRQELITRGNLKRYIDPISQLISIIVRRLLKKNSPNPYAKEFKKELERKGLTEDDLKEIRGARNTGKIEDILGNTAANTQIIFAEFRGDPEVDQFQLKHRRIASVLDADAADELLITDRDQTKQVESQRQQAIEISTIIAGVKIPASPRDNHQAHLQVILEWLAVSMQQQAQNFVPERMSQIKGVIDHALNHLGFLEADKSAKAIFKDFQKKIKEVQGLYRDLEKQALAMAKVEQEKVQGLAETPDQIATAQQMKQQLEQAQTQLNA